MTALMNATAAGIRFSARISPALSARVAVAAFFLTTRMRVRDADSITDRSARRATIRVGGRDVTTYQWGTGTSAALLLHGWNGRASQFATLVRDLVGEGYRVVAFDAPAHGDSAGRRTDVRDWVEAARMLAGTEGPFDLVVGHSFGAFAALAALHDGVGARRIVSIAGAGTIDAFHDQFWRMSGLGTTAPSAFQTAFYRRLGLSRDEAEARYDSLMNPLPPHTEMLIVHDAWDRALDARNSVALHTAHAAQSRLLMTDGLGHNRMLRADVVLDAVLAFAAGGLDGVDGSPAARMSAV